MRRLPVAGAFVGLFLALPPSRAQAPAALQPPPAPALETAAAASKAADAVGAKVWLGHYADFEEYLRTAAIQKIGDIPVGVTKPKRAFFEPGGMAGSAALSWSVGTSRWNRWTGSCTAVPARLSAAINTSGVRFRKSPAVLDMLLSKVPCM